METLFLNLIWMTYNLCLGVIAVTAGWLAIKKPHFWFRIVFGFVWFLFMPNTLYMLTDIAHLTRQWNIVGDEIKILLILQYGLFIFLAIALFVWGLYPLEKFLIKVLTKRKYVILAMLVIMNFVIGFGVAMGRVERTTSWEVVINTGKVINDSINVATSPSSMMLAAFFGIVGNVIYFSLKTEVVKYGSYVAKKVLRIRGSDYYENFGG